MAGSTPLSRLANTLWTEFADVRDRRQQHMESVWLEDARQYKGRYDPDIEARLGAKRSRAFMRLTKIKCDVILARLLDLLFPSTGEANWAIASTPKPHPAWVRRYLAEVAQQDIPADADLEPIAPKIAEQAAEAMTLEMKDQLAEGPSRRGYRSVNRSVLKSGLIYGLGILKGPLVERRSEMRWVFLDGAGEGGALDILQSWDLSEVETGELLPYFTDVLIWNFYPDMDCVNIKDARFVWETSLLLKADMEALAQRTSFNGAVIRDYLRQFPEGDATLEPFERDLRGLDQHAEVPRDLTHRYRVRERWGFLSGADLLDAGVAVDRLLPESERQGVVLRLAAQKAKVTAQEEADALRQHVRGREYMSNVWMLGESTIIKAVVSPLRGVRLPYYLWYYEKDESSIFGEGVPRVMRDPQAALNAAVRKMLDQAAISGVMFGINEQACRDDDPQDIHNGRVFLFENVEDVEKAIKMWLIPANTEHYLHIVKLMQLFADEVTTPSFAQGSGRRVKGAGETASGLSMLMGALQINLKELVRTYDDCITSPFVKALYHWNMQFSQKPEIMCDADVVAKGSSALIAKEIHGEKLIKAAELSERPRFAGMTKERDLLAEIFRKLDVSADLLRTDEEFAEWQVQQARHAARAQVEAMLEAVEEKFGPEKAEEALAMLLQTTAAQTRNVEAA